MERRTHEHLVKYLTATFELNCAFCEKANQSIIMNIDQEENLGKQYRHVMWQ